jgi:hypothetical protein
VFFSGELVSNEVATVPARAFPCWVTASRSLKTAPLYHPALTVNYGDVTYSFNGYLEHTPLISTCSGSPGLQRGRSVPSDLAEKIP